jgi:hypothetical protein
MERYKYHLYTCHSELKNPKDPSKRGMANVNFVIDGKRKQNKIIFNSKLMITDRYSKPNQ